MLCKLLLHHTKSSPIPTGSSFPTLTCITADRLKAMYANWSKRNILSIIFPGCRQPSQEDRRCFLYRYTGMPRTPLSSNGSEQELLLYSPTTSPPGWVQKVPFRVPAWQQETDSEIRTLETLPWDGSRLVNAH